MTDRLKEVYKTEGFSKAVGSSKMAMQKTTPFQAYEESGLEHRGKATGKRVTLIFDFSVGRFEKGRPGPKPCAQSFHKFNTMWTVKSCVVTRISRNRISTDHFDASFVNDGKGAVADQLFRIVLVNPHRFHVDPKAKAVSLQLNETPVVIMLFKSLFRNLLTCHFGNVNVENVRKVLK